LRAFAEKGEVWNTRREKAIDFWRGDARRIETANQVQRGRADRRRPAALDRINQGMPASQTSSC